MKRFVLFVLLAALPRPALADWVIVQKTESGSEKTIYISNAGYKEASRQQEEIWRFTDHMMIMVDHQKKQYSQINSDEFMKQMAQMLNQMKEQMGKSGNAGKLPTATPPKKTGSEVVAGQPCDKYEKSDASGRRFVSWVAPGITMPASEAARMRRYVAAMGGNEEPGDIEGTELRRTEAGRDQIKLDTLKVEKRAVAATEFQPPAGYKQVPFAFGR